MTRVMGLGLGFPRGPLMATALLAEKYMVLLVCSGPVQGQRVRVGDVCTSNQVVRGLGARPIECTGTRSTPFKREDVRPLFHQCNLSSKMASGAEKWGPNPWAVWGCI